MPVVTTMFWTRSADARIDGLVGIAAAKFRGRRAAGAFGDAVAAVTAGLSAVHLFATGLALIVWRSPPEPRVRWAFGRACDEVFSNYGNVPCDVRHLCDFTEKGNQ